MVDLVEVVEVMEEEVAVDMEEEAVADMVVLAEVEEDMAVEV